MSTILKLPPILKVGITGHRKLGDDPAVEWFVHAECVRILDRLRAVTELRQGEVVAYSALAIGADQLFSRAALGLGLPLVGIIPFAEYAADFVDLESRDYDALLSRCREVHRLPSKRRSKKAYMDAGKWIVDRVDTLIAVWDGQPAAGLGGTGDVVDYAERKGRPIIRIDIDAPSRTRGVRE
jgi:hypothetical protein